MTDETTTEQLAEIEGQAESTPATEYTPPEGWRVLAVGERLRFGDMTVRKDGYCYSTERVGYFVGANQRYIRPIEPQPQPQPQPEPVPEPNAATIEELRSEVSYVQNLLGTERRRVTQLEELVASLRTINEGAEKAVEAAGKENSALRNQLEAAKAELVQERLERNRWHNQVLRVTSELDDKTTQCEILQIELDAAQQVPADSPELRQLRLDLAEVTQDRDTYRHAHELLVNDVNATHQRTKVMTIEAIVEWLVPIRTCGSQALATAVISNLPHIMRSLTGLEDEGIE